MNISTPYSRGIRIDWYSLWRGSGTVRAGIRNLFWAVVRLLIAGWLWTTALELARFGPPLQTIGAGLALACVALLAWSLWGMWKGIRALGLYRLLVTVIVVFCSIVALMTMTIPDERPVGERIVAHAGTTAQGAWRFLASGIEAVIRAPDEFLFAHTGRRAPLPPLPGVPPVDPSATPVRLVVSGDNEPAPPLAPRVGDLARVSGTGGDALRARSGPGLSFAIVARFPEGSQVELLDGPVAADGFRWWRVRGEQGEGWCADRWLTPGE